MAGFVNAPNTSTNLAGDGRDEMKRGERGCPLLYAPLETHLHQASSSASMPADITGGGGESV
jgi:hypothetical protein